MGARTVGQSRTGSGFPEPDLSHGSRLIEQPNGREDGIVGTVQGKSSSYRKTGSQSQDRKFQKQVQTPVARKRGTYMRVLSLGLRTGSQCTFTEVAATMPCGMTKKLSRWTDGWMDERTHRLAGGWCSADIKGSKWSSESRAVRI